MDAGNNESEIDLSKVTFGTELGSGSYGRVIKAVYNNKTVAVKKLIDLNYQKFKDEIAQLRRADHINIIKIIGDSRDNNFLYIFMEYAEGGSLQHFLHIEKTEYSLKHVINWSLQCCKAVAYLHTMRPRPVIHRDIKPSNLLLMDEKRALKICDFGTVRDMATTMSNFRGSAPYMAPEVAGGESYTQKCDVYSFGISLWEMLSRKKPFNQYKESVTVTLKAISGMRPEMTELIFDCSDDIQKLIKNSWAGEPENRPDIKEVVETLSKLGEALEVVPEELSIK